MVVDHDCCKPICIAAHTVLFPGVGAAVLVVVLASVVVGCSAPAEAPEGSSVSYLNWIKSLDWVCSASPDFLVSFENLLIGSIQ